MHRELTGGSVDVSASLNRVILDCRVGDMSTKLTLTIENAELLAMRLIEHADLAKKYKPHELKVATPENPQR